MTSQSASVLYRRLAIKSQFSLQDGGLVSSVCHFKLSLISPLKFYSERENETPKVTGMPTVDKKGKYDLEGQEGEVNNEMTSASQSSQNVWSATKSRKSLAERSAFSETDLKAKLAAKEEGIPAKGKVVTHYSESDIQLAKLDVPLFDDSRSEISGQSGSSGLAIVPFLDGRSLISQESGQDLVLPAHNEIVPEEDHDKDKLEQEGKGTCIAYMYIQLTVS